MKQDLENTIALLERTPAALDALLRGLPEMWTETNEGENTWSVRTVIAHLIHEMKCPYCGFGQDRVVDSRESKEADSIRRRRECESCNRRFTTYERIDEIPYMVVKKDGRRERFDRQKSLSGLLRACEKRPVRQPAGGHCGRNGNLSGGRPGARAHHQRDRRADHEHLKGLDTVAYIRFASVYRDFKDVREFKEELEGLLGSHGGQGKK
jgi:transcriptional repressor NrdR